MKRTGKYKDLIGGISIKGHIEQRANGSWRVVIEQGCNPVTNKRQRIYKTVTGTKREAEKVMYELLLSLQTRTHIDHITLGEYLQRWLNTYCEPNLAPKTVRGYKAVINTHIIPALGMIRLQKLSPLHLQEYYAQKLSSGGQAGQGGLAPGTVRHHHEILKAALNRATQLQLISSNPVDKAIPPRMREKPIQLLSIEKIQEILSRVKGNRDYLLMFIAVHTGLRLNELLSLRWEDLDLSNHTINIRQRLEYIDGQGLFVTTSKTDRKRLHIAITPEVAAMLRTLHDEQDQDKIQQGSNYEDYGRVFCWENGRPLSKEYFVRRFRTITKQAKRSQSMLP